MRSLKFCCPVCGSNKFIFTCHSRNKKTRHGASCACCQRPLTVASCLTGVAEDTRWAKI